MGRRSDEEMYNKYLNEATTTTPITPPEATKATETLAGKGAAATT